jgi:hypothetical protein
MTMTPLFKEIRRNPLLWLLAFVPVVFVARRLAPEQHTLLFVLSVLAAPPLAARLAAVEGFAAEMRPLGIANFLYSDGEFVFGHGRRRTQADGIVAPPGLWFRHRHRGTARGASATPTTLPSSGVIIHSETGYHAGKVQEMALLARAP